MEIRLYDNPTTFYHNFIKRFFNNIYESLSFYSFLGKVSDTPIIGRTLKPFLELYAKRFHAAALPLPLPQMIDVVSQAKVIAVDDCVCRNMWDRCDRPKRTCFKILTGK